MCDLRHRADLHPSYDNPKGNAETERMMRTIKEEWLWLHECGPLEEARAAIGRGIEQDDHCESVHSAWGYRSPLECEAGLMREAALAA